MLHPDDKDLFKQVEYLTLQLAGLIGEQCIVEPKRRPNGAHGLCYHKERRIAILVRYKEKESDGGRWHRNPFPWFEIRKTIAHEVAHLIHPNHGVEFKELESWLLNKAQEIV